jgi:AraC-like DNA-binding protein
VADDRKRFACEEGGFISWVAFARLPGVQVLNVEGVSRQWEVFHETFSLCTPTWVENFAPVGWRYRLHTHQATPTGIQLMEPGELHRNLARTPQANFHVLMLQPERVTNLLAVACGKDGRHSPHLRLAQVQSDVLREKLLRVTLLLVEHGDAEAADDALYDLVFALSSQGALERPLPPAMRERGRRGFREARELLHARWNEHVPLARLVEVSGLPLRTLQRVFRNETGVSARRYQHGIQLRRAKELIDSTNLPLATICRACGIPDRSQFCDLFHRAFVCSPREYSACVRRSRCATTPGSAATVRNRPWFSDLGLPPTAIDFLD